MKGEIAEDRVRTDKWREEVEVEEAATKQYSDTLQAAVGTSLLVACCQPWYCSLSFVATPLGFPFPLPRTHFC